MFKYPRYVYMISPLTEDQKPSNIAYIGSANNVYSRVRQHYFDKYGGPQERLHELMREYGYVYRTIDVIYRPDEDNLEYAWINLLKTTNYEVTNVDVRPEIDYKYIPFTHAKRFLPDEIVYKYKKDIEEDIKEYRRMTRKRAIKWMIHNSNKLQKIDKERG